MTDHAPSVVAPAPISAATKATGHESDSYGVCTICRYYVPHTEADYETVAWPCPVVQLAALRAESVAAPDMVLVRKDSGGVFADGTTNHPPIDFERGAESVAVSPWNDADMNVAYGIGYEAGKSAALHAPPALDADRLLCGQCGDDLLPHEIEGHLLSEGRLLRAATPASGEPAPDGYYEVLHAKSRNVVADFPTEDEARSYAALDSELTYRYRLNGSPAAGAEEPPQ